MLIIIKPEEIGLKCKKKINLKYVKDISIDYATNTLDCYFEDELQHIVHFKDYGIVLDNRFNTYVTSYGSAGIIIEINESNI